MLATLRIKNVALVSELNVEFKSGLNTITGETGAGKSILIGALNLVLGDRADRTLVRAGADACSVEAVIACEKQRKEIAALLDEHGLDPCEGDQLLLKRSVTATGASRQWINGSPTTVRALALLGELLMDMHGPHDHQSLLRPAKQLELLDAFAGLQKPRLGFTELVRQHAALQAEKAGLIIDEQTYAQQLDLLRFQVREIEDAQLQADEEALLENEHRRARNAARLIELVQNSLQTLSEDDSSITSQLGVVGKNLQELSRLDADGESLVAQHGQLVTQTTDLQSALSHYADRLEVDPARLNELEERLTLIQGLKRKYGPTVSAVIEFGTEARRKLASLESRDLELGRLNTRLDEVKKRILDAGRQLSALRRKAIPQLSKTVTNELTALGFKKSQFEVVLISANDIDLNVSPSLTGLDTLDFQFAPNPGEPAKPLRSIASSGEMARVMLAIKTVLAKEDQIPILIFDEVDANVGGETAHAVGQKLHEIARTHQVFCITHLPQVAACADAHYLAEKVMRDERTVTEITLLDSKARVTEVARMLGGQSAASRKHAQELLAKSH